MIRRRVRVHGHVQGVFFRDACQGEAAAAGVNGWVRNCSDGTVEAVFEGEESAVKTLSEWCRQGPPKARVNHIDIVDEEPDGESSFEVH
ncbi:MAG: acylphosphatase [Nocardioidaceae bacterium]